VIGGSSRQRSASCYASFGGPYSALDASLRRPFTDEVTLGLEQHLAGAFRPASVSSVGMTKHLVEMVNAGCTSFELRVDDCGLIGQRWSPPALQMTKASRFLTGSLRPWQGFPCTDKPAGYRASYKGFEVELLKLFASHWESRRQLLQRCTVRLLLIQAIQSWKTMLDFIENDTVVDSA